MQGRVLCGAILGLFALMVAGCGSSAVTQGGKPREKVYRSAVSLSPSTTEIMLRFAVGTNLVGRTEACNWPVGRIGQIPSVMRGTTPNFEQIAALRPDLVVYDPELFSAENVAKIKELGIDTLEIAPTTFDEWVATLYRVGAKLGNETEISRTLDQAKNTVEVAGTNVRNPLPKVAVILASNGAGEHLIRGTEGFLADIVKRSGGEMTGPAGTQFVPVNAESLLSQNPEVIIVGGDPSPILRDPRLRSLQAVQKQYVFGINQDVLLRRGARVPELVAALNRILFNPEEGKAEVERRRAAAAANPPATPAAPPAAPPAQEGRGR